MTIADDPKNLKARKKATEAHDALAALQAAMRASIASNVPAENAKLEAAPTAAKTATRLPRKKTIPAAESIVPELTELVAADTGAVDTAGQKPAVETSYKSDAPPAADTGTANLSASDWPAMLMRIAERSRKLLQNYAERHQNAPLTVAPFDPAHLTDAFMELSSRLMNTPEQFVDRQLAFWQDYLRLCQSVLARLTGQNGDAVIAPAPNDKRFQDAAWRDIWMFDFIKQSYLLTARWAQGLTKDAKGLDPKIAKKIEFYTRQMVDAVSPSNFWMTNPAVLRATIESGGENLVKGFEHLLADLERGQGQLAISMSDNRAFHFGENIATTKGKVVFQNELMQLLQFSPLTEQVHTTPLLIVPPWINKYYILDLREKNSFIRYLVAQGHTVFCVSWVNPDKRHAAINFDDYMELGLLAAMREISSATGENDVNVIGYCIGGTLLASTIAYLDALGDAGPKNIPAIASATYLVTMLDFKEPGDLGVFIDEEQIQALEARMSSKGYLEAPVMAMTFNLLRANDLIWSFVVNNYLLGREPFPFDLLYWNSDSTNLPEAMQSFYLRNMYMENRLVMPDSLRLKDVPIDLRRVKVPAFFLSTKDDHIAPWRSTYAGTQLFSGPVSFTLSGSGHIAGVVNPPNANKYGYSTNATCPADADEWLAGADSNIGSWWLAWEKWVAPFTGPMVAKREPKNAIEDAPGSYVMVRAV